MKALVYHGNKDAHIEEVDEPRPGPGEVKLRIDYCGICATDIEEYQFGPKFIWSEPNPVTGKAIPLVVGHEMTGTVVEAPGAGNTVSVGDRVALNTILTCGKCYWCRAGRSNQCQSMAVTGFGVDGGLAEYMTWTGSQLVRLPDDVSSKAAALTEPSSVANHAVRRGRIHEGDRVAIVGAGTVGLLAMQLARAAGATVFAVDRRPMSLDMARQLGADKAVNSEQQDPVETLKQLTDGVGPDVVIDAAGAPQTPALAVNAVRAGGRVVLVAVYTSEPQFDFNTVVMGEKEVVGSLAYEERDVEEVVRLISDGSLKTTPLISDIIGLDEVIDVGYARMLAPTKEIFRILVAPSGQQDG